MRVVLGQIAKEAKAALGDEFVSQTMLDLLAKHGGHGALNIALSRWSRARKEPLVLLIDEIDTLVGDSLISVLRQLRAGYPDRPRGFPQSIILCGVREPSDYRTFSTSPGNNVTWGSGFNITAKSLRLADLTEAEVRSLLGQHTAQTGQEFAPGVIGRIWHLTQGQPWLVNALALQACFQDKAGRDRSRPIGLAAIHRAKETLVLNRGTHLDHLANQLGDERVRRVILPMIAGSVNNRFSARDLEYVRDLGLVAAAGPVRMANPIYAEVVPRELTVTQQSVLESLISPTWYVRKDGGLNLPKLLKAIQGYFRENSESWLQRYGHREAGAHLMLQSYLHRVVDGGGRITREYALARRRSDLLIEWPRPGGTLHSSPSKRVVECKVVGERSGLKRAIREGLRQTESYMDLCSAESGHLVVFDMRPERTWKERIFTRSPEPGQAPITVWGM